MPIWVLALTCEQVAGLGEPIHGSAASQVLQCIRIGLLGAAMIVLVIVAGMILPAQIRNWAGSPAAPRRRWQYLLAAICSLAIASAFLLLTLREGNGVSARLCFAAFIWSGLYGLTLTGRAASRGHVRALLWWAPLIGAKPGIGAKRAPQRSLPTP